jgi:hypothetical protein
MKAQRPDRSFETLRVASIHVHYELRMLRDLAVKLETGQPDHTTRCAYLESFTIHARALHHFLWPTYIAHISYSRPSPGGEKQWAHSGIAVALADCMRKFRDDVDSREPGLLSDDWRAPVRHVMPLTPMWSATGATGVTSTSGMIGGTTYEIVSHKPLPTDVAPDTPTTER